jgi:hypothetical protein
MMTLMQVSASWNMSGKMAGVHRPSGTHPSLPEVLALRFDSWECFHSDRVASISGILSTLPDIAIDELLPMLQFANRGDSERRASFRCADRNGMDLAWPPDCNILCVGKAHIPTMRLAELTIQTAPSMRPMLCCSTAARLSPGSSFRRG